MDGERISSYAMGNVPACCASDSAADVPVSPGSAAAAAGMSGSAAGQGISSRPVAEWDVAEVEAWVLAVGLPPEAAAAFHDAGIEGDSLLSLTREEIEQDVGIRKVGHRKRIFKALKELKEGRSPAEQAAASDGAGNGRLDGAAAASDQLAQLGDAAGKTASKLSGYMPSGLAQRGGDRFARARGRAAAEETSPVTRTERGFGLSVMESAPSLDDAVVVDGGFCTAVPVGSRVVRVNGTAVRSVDDIRTVLAEVPVGDSAEIGYSPPPP